MSDRIYYVICEDNCKFEGMTKEQILAAITQAVEQGEIHDVDTGFVTKIKEQNAGRELKFWVGTQAQYNAISEKAENVMYLITDPQLDEEIEARLAAVEEEIEERKQPIDITEAITLTPSTENITVTNKYYVYDPANGIVRFWVRCRIGGSGSIAAQTPIKIAHTGGYNPKFGATPIMAHDYLHSPNAEYSHTVAETLIVIRDEERSIESWFYVTGWYFCDGE